MQGDPLSAYRFACSTWLSKRLVNVETRPVLFVFVKKHTRGGESRKEGGDTEESRK